MAKVPYSPVPGDTAQGVPNDYQNVPTSPGMFGALVGQGEEKLGSGLQQAGQNVADIAMQRQVNANAIDANERYARVSQQIGTLDAQFRTLQGNNAYNAKDEYAAKIVDLVNNEGESISSPAEKLLFMNDARRLASQAAVNLQLHAGDQQQKALVTSQQSAIQAQQDNIVRYTQAGQLPDFTNLINSKMVLQHQLGAADPTTLGVATQEVTGQAVHNMINARIVAGDMNGAAKVLEMANNARIVMSPNGPPTVIQTTNGANPDGSLPLLDPKTQDAIAEKVQQKTYIDAVRQRTAIDAQDKIARDANVKSESDWAGKILTNPTGDFLPQIANDPSLTGPSKEMLAGLLQKHLKDTTDGTAATYGDKFYDTLKAATAAPGDPNRIADPNEVLRMALPGGGLTLAGAKEINGILEKNKTAEGRADNTVQAGAIAYAKRQLSFEADYGFTKVRDPVGEDRFSIGFTPAFMKYWQDGIAAGKTPSELANKDEIDKVLAPFKRSPGELTRDSIQAGIEAPTGTAIPQLPQGIPPGSQFSPSRQMWRDPSGKLYDSSGKPR